MATLVGSAILVALLGCVASLPWTLGRVTDPEGGPSLRRAERGRLDAALLPPSWAPHAPDERQRADEHRRVHGHRPRALFGTDRLGRDLFTRCLAGGGLSLALGVAAGVIAVAIGTMYGTVAALVGGRTDAVMMRVVDVLYGLPTILIVVLVAVAMEGALERLDAIGASAGADRSAGGRREALNLLALLVAIGGVGWLTMARVIRGQVLSLRQQPFMEACRAMGVPFPRQVWRHLIPNLIGPIVVYTTLTVPQAILSESFLSFLGIGIHEPLPSWGNLAAAGLSEINTIRVRWWLLAFPCGMIAAALLGLNFVGERLRQRLDPRRRWP
jgi:oligopeptide transport system permease protein